MRIDDLLQNQHALPSAPKVVEELIGSFEDPDASVDAIARKLAQDPVLSAKLLRLANSAYYHASRKIASVDDAIRMLGFVSVRSLVVSAGLVGSFKSVPGIDLKQFWRYSLESAVAAKWIARQAHENTDLAFTIGLMHALGELVIHTGMPDQAVQLDDETAGPFHPDRQAVERAAFGFSFADVGAGLAERWKFPIIFGETIRTYAEPLPLTPLNRIAGVLCLAVWAVQHAHGEAADDSFPAEVATALGLAPAVVLADMPPLEELSAGLEELVKS
ncbi:MAG: HDOD domain-containing protein [Telluria sp.]